MSIKDPFNHLMSVCPLVLGEGHSHFKVFDCTKICVVQDELSMSVFLEDKL